MALRSLVLLWSRQCAKQLGYCMIVQSYATIFANYCSISTQVDSQANRFEHWGRIEKRKSKYKYRKIEIVVERLVTSLLKGRQLRI